MRVVVTLLAALVVLLTALLLRTPATPADSSAELKGAVVELSDRLDQLELAVSRLATAEMTVALPAPVVSPDVKVPQVEVEETVAVGLDDATLTLLNQLANPTGSVEERGAILKELGKLGHWKDATALLQELVAEDPTHADNHYLLGNSLASTLRSEDVTAKEAAELTRGSREALGAALELDAEHWEARFTRAMLNAFSPGASARQLDAIQDLEELARQSANRRVEPRDASTWYFLGNLRLQQQQSSAAREAWTTGARLFPDDPRFPERLAVLDADQ